ncbi:MAG: tetratricopeptide repeat protein [Cyanobacteria bacterium]|nr:tetratricopeptide repeat protein [Cyanobacteriota bacterium]
MTEADVSNKSKWDDRIEAVEKHLLNRDYSTAEQTLVDSIHELEQSKEDNVALGMLYEKIAECHWYMARLDSALNYSNKVVRAHLVSANPNLATLVAFHTNRAMIAHSALKLDEAEQYYRSALKTTSDLLGEEHSYTTKLKSLFADLLTLMNKEDEAKELGTAPRNVTVNDWLNTRILELITQKDDNEEDHIGAQAEPDKPAQAVKDVGLISISKEEAKLIFESNKYTADNALRDGHSLYADRLWQINLKLLKQFDVKGAIFATTLDTLSDIKTAQKNYKEAVDYAEESYTYKKQQLGNNDASVGQSANQLAQIYYLWSDYEKAEPFAKECVSIYEKVHGKDHADVASALHNLATLYHVQRKYDHAESIYQKALEIKNNIFGPDHPETQRLLTSYAELLKQTNAQAIESSKAKSEAGGMGMITGTWKIGGSSAKLKMESAKGGDRCDICGTFYEGGQQCTNCGYDPKFGF